MDLRSTVDWHVAEMYLWIFESAQVYDLPLTLVKNRNTDVIPVQNAIENWYKNKSLSQAFHTVACIVRVDYCTCK